MPELTFDKANTLAIKTADVLNLTPHTYGWWVIQDACQKAYLAGVKDAQNTKPAPAVDKQEKDHA